MFTYERGDLFTELIDCSICTDDYITTHNEWQRVKLCKNDLQLPDVRLLRPRTLVIHDNLKKKIFFINNIFRDEIIKNYETKYNEIKSGLFKLKIQSSIKSLNNNIDNKSRI